MMAGPVGDSLPDPDSIEDRICFGRALTIVRERAGLTVRDVARTVGIPVATTGDYFAGRSLPPVKMASVLPDILRVCGVVEPGRVASWQSALIRIRLASGRPQECARTPYRGLAAYRPEHAQWLFGRARLVTTMLSRCSLARRGGLPVAVVGPSGAGKTSALLAGLVPALDADPAGSASPYRTLLVNARRDPCRRLADQLSHALGASVDTVDHLLHVRPTELGTLLQSSGPQLTLIVDQVEELFLPEVEIATRDTFLSAAAALSRAGVVVVFAIRAEARAAVVGHPLLRAALSQPLIVEPMTEAELAEVIEGPARRAGVGLEPGFVSRVVHDTMRLGADPSLGRLVDPLPMLSHALLMTWRRKRNTLSIADYQSIGGVRGAIRHSAETAFTSLTPAQRALAATVFAKLVRTDAYPMRAACAVSRAELGCGPGDARRGETEQILDRFAVANLLTVGADSVEITHDALLTAWPRANLLQAHRWEAASCGADDRVAVDGADPFTQIMPSAPNKPSERPS